LNEDETLIVWEEHSTQQAPEMLGVAIEVPVMRMHNESLVLRAERMATPAPRSRHEVVLDDRIQVA